MGNNKMKAINDTAMSTNNFIILLYICLHRSPSMVTEMPLLTILLSNLLYSVRMAFHISFWSYRPRTIGRALIFIFLARSEEHTSELQSLMRISYAVFCLKKKKIQHNIL